MSETIPVRAGAYKQTSEGGVLLGGKCPACGKSFFPKPDLCFNCLSDEVDEVELSSEGRLFSWSTIHMPSAHFKPPYTVGYVDLPEGIRIFGPIKSRPAEDFRSGQLMKLEVAPLWEDDGQPVVGHQLMPAE